MKFFMIFLLAILSSCNQFRTYLRVKPELIYENGLLISNSQTNPYEVNIENNSLKINYNIIAKNISEKDLKVDLSNSFYQANDEKNKLVCNVLQSKTQEKILKINEQVAIICNIELIPNSTNKLTLKDSDIKLTVSLNNSSHSFTYRVFAEEFKR